MIILANTYAYVRENKENLYSTQGGRQASRQL